MTVLKKALSLTLLASFFIAPIALHAAKKTRGQQADRCLQYSKMVEDDCNLKYMNDHQDLCRNAATDAHARCTIDFAKKAYSCDDLAAKIKDSVCKPNDPNTKLRLTCHHQIFQVASNACKAVFPNKF